jgi:O-acetyl-ADP-ribose deacetylase (regulator of RNase III)
MSSDVYELASAFEPLSLRGMPEDAWSVIVHSIHQIVMGAYHSTGAYEDLRAAYYADLKANE